jgi:hypothetical protein
MTYDDYKDLLKDTESGQDHVIPCTEVIDDDFETYEELKFENDISETSTVTFSPIDRNMNYNYNLFFKDKLGKARTCRFW